MFHMHEIYHASRHGDDMASQWRVARGQTTQTWSNLCCNLCCSSISASITTVLNILSTTLVADDEREPFNKRMPEEVADQMQQQPRVVSEQSRGAHVS